MRSLSPTLRSLPRRREPSCERSLFWVPAFAGMIGLVLVGCAVPTSVNSEENYQAFSAEEAEAYRQIIYGSQTNSEWKNTYTRASSEFEYLIGQTEDEFSDSIVSHGFQRVGGIGYVTPYSCTQDPCACNKFKTITYARKEAGSTSFESISLSYGKRTFDDVCRPGLFDISPVKLYEKNYNAKNK